MSQPLVLIGPSGAGKSSVVKILTEKHGYTLIKTVTTRPQRDASDTDHEFITPEEFAKRKNAGAFFGMLDAFGEQYGLPKFNPADTIVLNLRAPAIPELRAGFPDAVVVEIDAPIEILKQRLEARGSSERFDPELLGKEIAFGRSLTNHCFDSSKLSAEEIAKAIIALY